MNAKQLKNALLQHAIQGRLVPQDPGDEPADVLLQRIRAEKEQLIKEGKIKKQKPLPPITEEEKPFAIPDSWQWVRLGEICTLINGRAYKQSELLNSGKTPVLRVGNLFTSQKWYYSNLELPEEKYCTTGDLLYSWSASFGPHIWNGEKSIFHYHIWKLIIFIPSMRNYLYHLLQAKTNSIKRSGHGLAMIHVTKENMELSPIPLPPLAEQQRIVARLEELLPDVEAYGTAQERLTAMESSFPQQLRKSLLQEAIQGRLVPQNPADESADVLLQRIRAEKEQLIKEGKIKKQKPLPPITEEEKPFAIPDSWQWVRLGEICTLINGRAYKQSELLNSGKTPVLRVGNLFTSQKWYYSNLELPEEKYCTTGDLLYSWSASFGPHIWNGEKSIFHYHIWKLIIFIPSMRNYLYHLLQAKTNSIKRSGHGLAMIHVTKENMELSPIPLPPLAEQQRIVARLEELLPLCDGLMPAGGQA